MASTRAMIFFPDKLRRPEARTAERTDLPRSALSYGGNASLRHPGREISSVARH